MDLNEGCPYVTGTSRVYNRMIKKWQSSNTHCHLIPAVGSVYCPKHKIIFEHEQAERRKITVDQAELAQQRRQEELEVLAQSPLAAVNPRFDEKNEKVQGYDR